MTFSRRNSALEPEEKEQGIDGIKMIIDTGFIQLRYTDVLGKFLAKYKCSKIKKLLNTFLNVVLE